MGPGRDRTLEYHRIESFSCSNLDNNTGKEEHISLKKRGGVQWLSGRVLDSRPRDNGFEPHRSHCVVVLEQDTFILA